MTEGKKSTQTVQDETAYGIAQLLPYVNCIGYVAQVMHLNELMKWSSLISSNACMMMLPLVLTQILPRVKTETLT